MIYVVCSVIIVTEHYQHVLTESVGVNVNGVSGYLSDALFELFVITYP